MKRLLLCMLLVVAAGSLFAQSRPNIDTVTLYNLVPGLKIEAIKSHVDAPIDTLMWDAKSRNGILKFARGYQGIHGEYRLAVDVGNISQIIFTAPVRTPGEVDQMYKRLSDLCITMYGEPDVNYHNAPYREVRWEGLKQSVSVKTRDSSTYVSLVLSTFERH